jgi:hypothetical protein
MRQLIWLLLLALTATAAQATQSYKHLFPALEEPVVSGRPVSITVSSRPGDVVQLTPITFLSKPGTNIPAEGSKPMCGLVIDAPGRPREGLVTIGTGQTEATPGCEAVLAIGGLPAASGQSARRIGLIHATLNRNVPNNREIVVLSRDDAGRWVRDDRVTERVNNKIRRVTIAEMRRLLR